MVKSELRKQALARRNALRDEDVRLANEKLLEGFKTLGFAHVKSIHFFLPIVRHKEPDTFAMINWLRKTHPEIEIIVPKANFATHELSHYIYLDQDDLLPNAYQIPEPQHARPFSGTPDMVLVPLLAFDERGYRVGYGKGFYDRFLGQISTQKIGVSFFNAVPAISDVHLNDIRLDQCITPHGIVNFKKNC